MRELTSTRVGLEWLGCGRRLGCVLVASLQVALVGCAGVPGKPGATSDRVFDPKLGVWSSPRVVAEGESVPRGGGAYLTGRSYTIAGRTYVPRADPEGYSVVGTASWYGDAFHGRRTANGEVFDKTSITAAHPTLPLPSYVRVTNMKNGRSMIVRVNDRGPYHGGRVMDVSQRVADALSFRGEGTARVKVEYIGRASLDGSDDKRLMASLRTDGTPASLDGSSINSVRTAVNGNGTSPEAQGDGTPESMPAPEPAPIPPRFTSVPLPPSRPFSFDEPLGAQPLRRRKGDDHLAGSGANGPMTSFAPDEPLVAAAGVAFHEAQWAFVPFVSSGAR